MFIRGMPPAATALDIHAALAWLELKPRGIHRVLNKDGGLRPYVIAEFASLRDAQLCAVRDFWDPAEGVCKHIPKAK